MRPLLDQVPAWAAHEARVRDAEAQRMRCVEEAASATAAHDAAVHDHRAAVAAAVRDGQPLPPEPQPPAASLQLAAQIAFELQGRLAEERRRLRAELAPQVEQLAEAEWARDLDALRPAAQQIAEAARRAQARAREVRAARDDAAQGIRETPSRAERTNVHWNPGDLVHAVLTGISPYALAPLTPAQPSEDGVLELRPRRR